jgi:hypothetical protein
VDADSAMMLLPGERAGVRFSLPIDTARARARVVVRDPAGAALPFGIVREDAGTVRLDVTAPRFEVMVGDASGRFRVATGEDLGGIAGSVAAEGRPTVVEIIPEAGTRGARRTVRPGSDGTFLVGGLAPGSYHLRAWIDDDADGTWDAGSIAPYDPPEPMGWLTTSVRVRARWDTDLGAVTVENGTAVAAGLADERIQE